MKGPKGLLAEAIAKALANWFVVDPTTMETNLLSNTGIQLHDTQVKPQNGLRLNPHTIASLRGSVNRVSFVWTWGKSEGGSDWVKDAELRISGLDVVLALQHDEEQEDDDEEEETTNASDDPKQKQPKNRKKQPNKPPSNLLRYVKEQVQRILDTVTLVVDDVRFTIELPDGSGLVLGGNGLTLVSFGRPSSDHPLQQDLAISRLYCNVVSLPSQESHNNNSQQRSWPVLEDISYKAHIERTSGNRFQSGIQHGVIVTGASTDQGVTIHAGSFQINVVNTLVGMLVHRKPLNQRVSLTELRDSVLQGSELGSILVADTETAPEPQRKGETVDGTALPATETKPSPEAPPSTQPSVLQLPLSGVCLVLPNQARLSLHDFILKYHLDGSLLRIEGTSGFHVDQHPLVQLGETTVWYVDLVDRKVCLEDAAASKQEEEQPEAAANVFSSSRRRNEDEFVVCVHARKQEVDKVVEGVNEALGIVHNLAELKATEAVSSVTSDEENENEGSKDGDEDQEVQEEGVEVTMFPLAPAWGLEINGRVGVLYEHEGSDVEMTLRNVMGDLASKSLRISSIDRVLMPETFVLGKPLLNTVITLDNRKSAAVRVNLTDVLVVLKEAQQPTKPVNESSTTTDATQQQERKKSVKPKASTNIFSSLIPSAFKEEPAAKEETSDSSSREEGNAFAKSINLFQSSKPCAKKEAPTTDVSSSVSSLEITPEETITLPIGIHLLVDKFISLKRDGKSVYTSLEKLNVKLDPTTTKGFTQVSVALEKIHHEMFRLTNPQLAMSTVLFNPDFGVRSFYFRADEIMVKTGYSINDWISLAPKTFDVRESHRQENPVKMPFAHIDKLKIRVNVQGTLVGLNNSVLHVGAFDGNKTTTTKDLEKFYNEKVITRIPGMIKNTQVLGTNVTDNTVGYLGGAMLTGATPAGGILGLAAFDGIRNTMKEGRRARSPEEEEQGWQLADFSRGLKHAAIRATKEGAKDRGKAEHEDQDVYDWATGASKEVVEYSKENKARLAGAGAGVGGFAAGFAVGGPIGGIAGAVLASAATQKTVEVIDDALKPKDGTDPHSINVVDINPDTWKNLCSGLLFKRRNFLSWEWRSLWFILTDEGILEYFNTKLGDDDGELFVDSSVSPRKALEITENHYIDIHDGASKPDEHLFAFTINTAERKDPLWVLAASTEEKRSQWVSALSDLTGDRKKNSTEQGGNTGTGEEMALMRYNDPPLPRLKETDN